MNLVHEYNKKYSFFQEIVGFAMKVYNTYRPGLLENAYEAALDYLLNQNGHHSVRQVYLPIYWENVQLDQNYRMDMVVDGKIIVELKAVSNVIHAHRKQLFNYMNLTHMPYGMIINFSDNILYSEWYERDSTTGEITRIRLMK